jgi:peptidoglycan hydrolase-like protein with peptidoglycan-binding domain
MKIIRHLSIGACALLLSCSHTETVPHPHTEHVETKAPERTAAKTAPKNPETGEAPKEATGGTKVARNPETLIVPGQLKRIQQKLHDRGLLEERPTGNLDDATRAALKRLQREEDLPQTGQPDHETVRKLGLDPDEVFAKRQ